MVYRKGAEMTATATQMWSTVADGWERHADFVEARGAHVTAAMLERTMPRPGERVLELACGAGDVGLAAAPLVAPGEVGVSDVAAEMVEIAGRRAAARGLENVTPRVFGVEAIDDRDASYDVVVCREGLMFAEPEVAVGEIARVLRPGGRAAVAVWGPPERNPWLRSVFEVVAGQLGRPVPPPGVRGPFSLADAGRLEQLLATGLDDVEVEELDVPLEAGSFDEGWHRTAALAGPLSSILAGLPDEARTAIEARLEEAVRPYRTAGGGLRFPGMALLGFGVLGQPGLRDPLLGAGQP
jgi:ubiquinone/menaquinone biosynthesis C-methylase UbiE